MTKTLRAQERYAQEVLEHLWDNASEICEATDEGIFYRGSIHMLVRNYRPSAQPGDVVNVLRTTGAISQAGHGLWQVHRKHVFEDDEGNPINVVPVPGRESPTQALERGLQDLNTRLLDVETEVESLKEIVMKWAESEGLVTKEVEDPR